MPRILQAATASVPLLVMTPALVYSLAEGVLDLGGGEKDVLLALPWLIWSLVFWLCSLVLIYRRWPVGRWVLRSALVSTGALVGLGFIAYVVSFLGNA